MARRQIGFTGYSCNLELAGQWKGEGASWQAAYYSDCAYYDTKNNAAQEHLGSVVVDARDTAHPVASTYLDTVAMLDPWESLKVNQQRGMVAAVNGTGGGGGPEFSVYDIKTDCTQPRLIADATFEGVVGHEGNWAPDGLTYYGSNGGNGYAIDVSDPASPALLGTFTGSGHGLSFSEDGNRGYIVSVGTSQQGNGLHIIDSSDFQSRRPNPQVKELGSVTWPDGLFAQHTIPVSYAGKPYIIFTDEGGYGAARIIDISDEAAPVVVSKLKLEIHLEENRSVASSDGAVGLIQYDGHYCSVDRQTDPTALACGYSWSGIRVFDIRDPIHPKEIAYFVPNGTTSPGPGTQAAGAGPPFGSGLDMCTSQSRFVPERSELWVTCQMNGFMVLKFTNGVWPFKS